MRPQDFSNLPVAQWASLARTGQWLIEQQTDKQTPSLADLKTMMKDHPDPCATLKK
jgi:hypothetical protein